MTTFATGLRCLRCDARFPLAPMNEGCPLCATDAFRSSLTTVYDYEGIRASIAGTTLGEPGLGIWRYRRLLPVIDRCHETGLGEGGTALVPQPSLAAEFAAAGVFVKDESRNPTWSFKDRLAAVAVSKARDFGATTLLASSSGNAGVALAAYAGRAGLGCIVLSYPGLPETAAVMMQMSGAVVVITSREGRWMIMREAVERLGWYPTTNFTDIPTNGAYGHEGYKTIAFELHEQLDSATPDYVVVPTAYAEGLFGIWKGFHELVELGLAERVPRMIACEPAGGPLLPAWRDPERDIARVQAQATIARGVGGTTNTYMGVVALRASDGLVAQADDGQISTAQDDLARLGTFAEPAAALSLAGLRQLAIAGEIAPGASIVLLSTSGGLKHLGPTLERCGAPAELDQPSLAELERVTPRVRDMIAAAHGPD
jgi:threonine synthase